jgi:hypothetical protein
VRAAVWVTSPSGRSPGCSPLPGDRFASRRNSPEGPRDLWVNGSFHRGPFRCRAALTGARPAQRSPGSGGRGRCASPPVCGACKRVTVPLASCAAGGPFCVTRPTAGPRDRQSRLLVRLARRSAPLGGSPCHPRKSATKALVVLALLQPLHARRYVRSQPMAMTASWLRTPVRRLVDYAALRRCRTRRWPPAGPR